MKKSDNVFQKMFAGIGLSGSSRVPLRSNVFKNGRGYSPIGQTGGRSGFFDTDRQSPLLGNAQPSNRLSGFYDRVSELKAYQLLDITKLATNLFRDYLINFLTKDAQQVITITNEDGSNNETVSERLNTILTKDLKIFEFIEDHLTDSIFFGTYTAMLRDERDDTGHKKFRFEELYDPTSTVIKKKKNEDGVMEEICLARGDDGSIYEIPRDEYFIMGSTTLRLINDLEEGWKDKSSAKPTIGDNKSKNENRDKVLRKESYMAGEPLFYSLILKVKELVIKELLISLLSLRDLSSPSLYGLAVDKGVTMEAANNLCARVQKMSNNYNELSSFLTAQFDATSFIESALTQNVKFFPDFNATISNKNSLLPLDKLSEKLLELMQNLDQCRQNILSPLGIPASIYDSASGSKWAILQQSERANSRVASLMAGIKGSIIELTASLYRNIYNDEIDTSNIKVHIFEKSTVEYNNQINQSESISALVTGISNILQTSLQTLDGAGFLLDPQKYLTYIQNQIKDIDPGADSFITEETIQKYIEFFQAKLNAQMEQIQGGMM